MYRSLRFFAATLVLTCGAALAAGGMYGSEAPAGAGDVEEDDSLLWGEPILGQSPEAVDPPYFSVRPRPEPEEEEPEPSGTDGGRTAPRPASGRLRIYPYYYNDWRGSYTYSRAARDARERVERELWQARDLRVDRAEQRIDALINYAQRSSDEMMATRADLTGLSERVQLLAGRMGDLAAAASEVGDAVRRSEMEAAFETLLEDLAAWDEQAESLQERLDGLEASLSRLTASSGAAGGEPDKAAPWVWLGLLSAVTAGLVVAQSVSWRRGRG